MNAFSFCSVLPLTKSHKGNSYGEIRLRFAILLAKILKFEKFKILRIRFGNKFPAGIYLIKVNNRNTRARCEICSKLKLVSAIFIKF